MENLKPRRILKDLKIITAISMGKNRNKDLAKLLDTDKSFTSKRIRELENRGLIQRFGEGKGTRYRINSFNVTRFLKSTVVITNKKKEVKDDRKEKEERFG